MRQFVVHSAAIFQAQLPEPENISQTPLSYWIGQPEISNGCNLYLTAQDLRQIDESLDAKDIERIRSASLDARRGLTESLANKVTYPLADPNHPAHAVLAGYVLRNVAGNESIPANYKEALPRALAKIAGITPDVVGLVKPASNWGKRATSVDVTLGHETRGAGFAYELIGTAAVIDQHLTPLNGGPPLHVYKHGTDRIDLGIKLQASYGQVEGLSRPRRGTVEADLFISRGSLLTPNRNIGVDFKNVSRGDGTGTYSGAISQSVLDGLFNAIRTDEVHEFHFVTNGRFSNSAKQAIDAVNERLVGPDGVPPIGYHERVWWDG